MEAFQCIGDINFAVYGALNACGMSQCGTVGGRGDINGFRCE